MRNCVEIGINFCTASKELYTGFYRKKQDILLARKSWEKEMKRQEVLEKHVRLRCTSIGNPIIGQKVASFPYTVYFFFASKQRLCLS